MKRHHLQRLCLIVSMLWVALTSEAALINDRRVAIIDSLRTELRHAGSPADSLNIMLNLYDILPRVEGNATTGKMVEIALRIGDTTTALDLLRNDANRHLRNEHLLDSLERFTAAKFPASEARDETMTFIRMVRNMRTALYTDKIERNKLLEEFYEQFNREKSNDIYERIVLTHGMCMVLSQDPNSTLLNQYLDTLGALIDRLPPNVISIRNLYNIHASTAYLDNNPERALACDRQSLKDIERLAASYTERGRVFRNYDATRYTIYVRMLSCFNSLSDKEFKDIYNEAMRLAEIDHDVQVTHRGNPLPELYKALREEDYDKAYPLLHDYVFSPHYEIQSVPRRIRMLRYYMDAAGHTGHTDQQLQASLALNDMLDEEMKFRTQGLFRQIRLAYADYEMRRRYNELELETITKRNRLTSVVTILSVVGLLLMTAFLILLLIQYRKMRFMAKSLKASNAKLKKESDNLKNAQRDLLRARDTALKANALKSDFIKNLSSEIKIPLQAINEYSRLIADCADASTREYLGRFTDLIDHNSDLLTTIINDVLHLSQLESDTMPVQKQIVSLRSICNTTIDTVRERVKGLAVELCLAPDLPDVQITTDQSRLHQILLNLLLNAVKFTTHGTITLGYTIDDMKDQVNFYVEDTGIGINPSNKEKIFERFVKLDPNSQGAGLGLTISRMLARLLGGDLSLDTAYTHGARFVLTLPK